MKKTERDRRRRRRELLLSLLIAVVLLGVIVGLSFWFQHAYGIRFDTWIMVGTDAVGFLILFGIVHHFIRTPDDD